MVMGLYRTTNINPLVPTIPYSLFPIPYSLFPIRNS
ncbi:hypothetical protein PCC9214_04234 [Planktothrix tepida]|nr:hypothetical protein PCC9214_04234 [Planktothrix tepida]